MGAAGRKQVDHMSRLSRITGNHREFRTNSEPTSSTNRSWHPRKPQRVPRARGALSTTMLWATTLWLAFSMIGSQSPEWCPKQTKRPCQTPQNSKGKVGTIYIVQNIRLASQILNIKNSNVGDPQNPRWNSITKRFTGHTI